jgi:hypothetical protein
MQSRVAEVRAEAGNADRRGVEVQEHASGLNEAVAQPKHEGYPGGPHLDR